jgi:LacI family gluconate utilization system Gnt-I transcriptional repressor
MTVSRVLNSPKIVAESTAQRVRQAIEQLGYVPNMIAGGLSSRRSRMVAAILPSVATPILAACIHTFADTLERAGYHVLLGLSGYDTEREDALVATILGRQPEGVLLTGAHRSDVARKLLARDGLPVVEIWDHTETPIDMLVGFDHAQVGAAVAEFFIRQGHKHFAVIGAGDERAQARRRGFIETAVKSGGTLVASATLGAPGSIAAARRAMREMAPRIKRRTALFCSSDLVAAGALIEAAAQGIAAPRKLAVCGFGDFDLGRAFEPAITTVSVDSPSIGRLAAEMLLRRLREEDGPRQVIVPFRIERRKSA